MKKNKLKTHKGISKRIKINGLGKIFIRKAAVHRKVIKKSSNMKFGVEKKRLLNLNFIKPYRKILGLKIEPYKKTTKKIDQPTI